MNPVLSWVLFLSIGILIYFAASKPRPNPFKPSQTSLKAHAELPVEFESERSSRKKKAKPSIGNLSPGSEPSAKLVGQRRNQEQGIDLNDAATNPKYTAGTDVERKSQANGAIGKGSPFEGADTNFTPPVNDSLERPSSSVVSEGASLQRRSVNLQHSARPTPEINGSRFRALESPNEFTKVEKKKKREARDDRVTSQTQNTQTKKQRQNAAKREKEKSMRQDMAQLQDARLDSHRRDLEQQRLQSYLKPSRTKREHTTGDDGWTHVGRTPSASDTPTGAHSGGSNELVWD